MSAGRRKLDVGAQPRSPRDTFHGRRRGRRLRPGLEVLLNEFLPEVAITLPEAGRHLEPAAVFAAPVCGGAPPDSIWLEIGFGAGEHLAWQAARHPEVGMIGAECFVNGIAALLRRVRDDRLANVRIYAGDARALLSALPDCSIGRAFILFPDPWPKTRHHKRRIVQEETLNELARVLRDGVELRLATDDIGYLRWMLERLLDHPDFVWRARGPNAWRRRPLDWPATRYEVKALQQGRSPIYLRFRRRARGLT